MTPLLRVQHVYKGLRGPGTLVAFHKAKLREHGLPAQHEEREQLVAYVNHGRWVVDCPCGAGVAVDQAAPACCFQCGGVYPRILWPAERELQAIEALLQERPRKNQNWEPGETPDKLRAENVRHLKPEVR
jgi:hypothetical protein